MPFARHFFFVKTIKKLKAAHFAIVVAGGSGSRMQSPIPKQFMLLDNKPILVHTLEKFLRCEVEKIILVLPEKDISYWQEVVLPHFIILQKAIETQKLKVAIGGATRYQSVRNGLKELQNKKGTVAIHDGVRPFVADEKIMKSFETAEKYGSAVLAVDSKDSVRLIMENGANQHIDRNRVKLIQTPQTFDLEMIQRAFEMGEQAHFTDDASVFEYAGHTVTLIEGSYENIKITTPEDIFIAKNILNK